MTDSEIINVFYCAKFGENDEYADVKLEDDDIKIIVKRPVLIRISNNSELAEVYFDSHFTLYLNLQDEYVPKKFKILDWIKDKWNSI